MVVGLCLLIGLAMAGYFIGNGTTRFKSAVRTVAVKGLVEQQVRADQAIWELQFIRTGSNVQDVHKKISSDRETGLAFLLRQGFTEQEISRLPARTVDKFAKEYGQQSGDQFRYLTTAGLVVKTAKVDLVIKASGATEELLAAGVILGGQHNEGTANPRYVVSTFNELRPKLLAEATKNARQTAQQFAADAGALVGAIRSANQGSIQIFGSDGNDESAPYSPTSTPEKKIRVVSTFEFALE